MQKEDAPEEPRQRRWSRGWLYLGLLALILVVSLQVENYYLGLHPHDRRDFRRRVLPCGIQRNTPAATAKSKPREIPVYDLVLPPLYVDSLPPLPPVPIDSTSESLGFHLSAEYSKPGYHYAVRYDSSLYKIEELGAGERFVLLPATGMGAEILDGEFAEHRNTLDPLVPWALEEAERHCAADGDDGSSWCERRSDAQMFRSLTGLRVIEFYQTHFDLCRGATTRTTFGPYFVVDLSRAGRRLGLLVYNDNEPSSRHEFVMREMVNSIRLVEP